MRGLDQVPWKGSLSFDMLQTPEWEKEGWVDKDGGWGREAPSALEGGNPAKLPLGHVSLQGAAG